MITDKEFEKLYMEKTQKEIAKILGISKTSVAVRARKLNLSKQRGTKAELALIIEE